MVLAAQSAFTTGSGPASTRCFRPRLDALGSPVRADPADATSSLAAPNGGKHFGRDSFARSHRAVHVAAPSFRRLGPDPVDPADRRTQGVAEPRQDVTVDTLKKAIGEA
jgi:hypothetical protein